MMLTGLLLMALISLPSYVLEHMFKGGHCTHWHRPLPHQCLIKKMSYRFATGQSYEGIFLIEVLSSQMIVSVDTNKPTTGTHTFTATKEPQGNLSALNGHSLYFWFWFVLVLCCCCCCLYISFPLITGTEL